MTGTYAPTNGARRILIAVLAFALAAAVAFAASVAPAGAGEGDDKQYSVEITSPVPAEVDGKATETFTVQFKNIDDNTVTQKAGSFFVDFSDGFTVNSASITNDGEASGGQAWEVVSTAGDNVIISALNGGERILVTETVSVAVNVTADPFRISGGNNKQLTTGGDQQDHGDFSGGNEFIRKGPEPSITITFGGELKDCTQGQGKCTTNEDQAANGATGASECLGCEKLGTLTVEADPSSVCSTDCEASWLADSTTGGFFFLIIRVASEDLGGKITILFEDPLDSGNFTAARNCQPPKRTKNCIDIKHPDYDKKAGVFPLKFESGDPRGGYR